MLAALALALLTGCGAVTGGAGLFGAPPQRAELAGGAVIVAGPPGYCIDGDSLRSGAAGDFLILGSCAALSGNPRQPAPDVPAVLTVSVSAQSLGSIARSADRLRAFFGSERGRAALARDGRADSVEVLQAGPAGGAFVLKAADRSAGLPPGLASEYWRALLDLRGRVVTLSVIEFDGRPMGDERALATLNAFIARLRAENPPLAGPAPAPAAPADADADADAGADADGAGAMTGAT